MPNLKYMTPYQLGQLIKSYLPYTGQCTIDNNPSKAIDMLVKQKLPKFFTGDDVYMGKDEVTGGNIFVPERLLEMTTGQLQQEIWDSLINIKRCVDLISGKNKGRS